MAKFSLDLGKELEHEAKNKRGMENAEDALKKAHEVKPLAESALRKWMLVVLLLVCLFSSWYTLTYPLGLSDVEATVTDQFWEVRKAELADTIGESYAKASKAEQMRLFQTRLDEMQSDPAVLAALEDHVDSTTNFFKDTAGMVYPYSGYDVLQEVRDIDSIDAEISVWSRIVYWWSELAGIIGVSFTSLAVFIGFLLVLITYFIGKRAGVYGGLASAFTLAWHKQFFSQHAGVFKPIILDLLLVALFMWIVVELAERKGKWWYLLGVFGVGLLSFIETPQTGFFDSGVFMVAKYQSVALGELPAVFGGWFMTIFLLLCGIACLYVVWKKKQTYPLFILAWLAVALFAGMVQVQYMPYIAVPLALVVGYGVAFVLPSLARFLHSLRIGFNRPSLVALFVVFAVLVGMLSNDLVAAKPFVDDVAAGVSVNIRQNSGSDAIIASWWDWGDIYPYITHRRVFWSDDNLDRGYWMSRVYMSRDSNVSLGLLKFMACGEKEVVDLLIAKYGNEGPGLLEEAAGLEDGKSKLKELGVEDDLIEALYCEVPELFIVAEESYIPRMSAMETLAEQPFNMDAPLRNVSVSRITECVPRDGLYCGGYTINGMEATRGGKNPVALYNYLNGTRIKRYDGVPPLSVVVYPAANRAWSIILEDKYAETMIIKMLAGAEIEGFTLVHTVDSPRQVVVYKVGLNLQVDETDLQQP
ncbi:MAG: hypothetical protein ACE5FT_00445 [Candidatus Nanoarchaeia archaeon]